MIRRAEDTILDTGFWILDIRRRLRASSIQYPAFAAPAPRPLQESSSIRLKKAEARGFTLIEVLAALMFLGILVPVVMEALSLSNHISSLSERRAVAAELAENKLNEELIGSYWQSETQTKGDFGTDYPGYRWEMTQAGWSGASQAGTSTAGSSDMTELDMKVIFPVQGRDQSVSISTLVSASLAQLSGTTSGTSSPAASTTPSTPAAPAKGAGGRAR